VQKLSSIRSFIIPQECGTVFYNFSLKEKTSWKIGGEVSAFIVCETIEELQKSLKFLDTNHINWIIIGQGSNLLIADGFINGVVLKLGKSFAKAQICGSKIIVGSAMFVPYLAHLSCFHGFKGLEHIVGIPGSLGGLITMNGGSMHKSISQNVNSVKVLNQNHEIVTLNNIDCRFNYRNSIFKYLTNNIILEAEIGMLESELTSVIRNEMIIILRTRKEKFPKAPSCGSVFKSDRTIYENFGGPGRIVEQLGFKGFQIGGAQVSTKHANFIINTKNAKANEILTIIEIIKERAAKNLHIELNTEVIYLNNDCKIQKL
jgi:UDP-N-acetylmuramate dehydrogenase